MNQVSNTAAEPVSDDKSANSAAHFAIAIRNFNGLLRTNSFAQALIWARQAEQLAIVAGEDTMKSSVREAYVAIILTCSSKFEANALHCGNITHAHAVLSDIIAESTDCLVETLRGGKEIPLMVALAVQGFSIILRDRVNAHSSRNLPTLGEVLNQCFESLDQIVELTSSLTRSADLYALSIDERFAFSATAMSNSGYEINWLLPSDWEKALFYCTRVLNLLSFKTDKSEQDAQAAPRKALLPKFQGIVDTIPALQKSLQQQQYRDSKRRIKAICAQFQAAVA
jgi:hypothetical protein